jgi:chitin disaccharide deacetylase
MSILIVNADDFGLSCPVNSGIVEAHVNGIVTSTSIMAVGAAFDDAVRLSRDLPGLDVGIHLTLVGESALLPCARVPTLVDEHGRLPRDVFTFARRFLGGRIRLSDVRAELNAQFERVRSAGIRMSHADSHQHVHMLGEIREVVADLCRAYGVPILRRPAEPVDRQLLYGVPALHRVAGLAAVRLACMGSWPRHMKRTDAFFGFYFGGRLSRDALLAVIRCLPVGRVSELMCHPGRYDARYADWGYSWAMELSALASVEVRSALAEREVVLSDFRSLYA